jgi:hypothetical protein
LISGGIDNRYSTVIGKRWMWCEEEVAIYRVALLDLPTCWPLVVWHLALLPVVP